ncbi:MAG: hypothetical protein ACUVXH_03850 [Anaerolineae bacterium]
MARNAPPRRARSVGRLLVAKVHLEPGAWNEVASGDRAQLDNPWAMATFLGQHLARLPEPCLEFLAGHPRGHLVISPGGSHYAEGAQPVGRRVLYDVAFIGVRELAEAGHGLWRPVGQLLDHLLGCHGEPGGPWLTDGGGISPLWEEVGHRLQALFPLGYGVDELTRSHPHFYLAQSLGWYFLDRRRLEAADPLVVRLLRTTLLDPAFWRRASPPGREPDALRGPKQPPRG